MSYLQSARWPQLCQCSEELEEPVKKKPRCTQVCLSYYYHFSLKINFLNELNEFIGQK